MTSAEGMQCENRGRPEKESWRKLTFKKWAEEKEMLPGHSKETRGNGGNTERRGAGKGRRIQ